MKSIENMEVVKFIIDDISNATNDLNRIVAIRLVMLYSPEPEEPD